MIGGKSSQSVFQHLTAARSPLDISHIRSFTINGSEQELLSVTAQIFQLASSTIECFVWELPAYSFRPHVSDAPWYHPLNLRDLTHLQTLILVEYDWVQQLSIVYALVTGCGLPNMLRNIVVMFQYEFHSSQGSIISFNDLEHTLQALKVDRALSAACYNSAHPLCITVWVFINDPNIDLETARNAVRSRFLKWFALTFAQGVEVKGGIEMRSKLPEILERLQA
ncbi:hypothetical protein D9615_009056 [Tricholomella constricta]|uniref:Uncharacterized protein n=1 Tax=Tricholomella constricta TaxID=117010 RepID=A0A8H5H0J7_9AGAR|nr:hypothetical protein D9615_009056 [Tricholomella constricta]